MVSCWYSPNSLHDKRDWELIVQAFFICVVDSSKIHPGGGQKYSDSGGREQVFVWTQKSNVPTNITNNNKHPLGNYSKGYPDNKWDRAYVLRPSRCVQSSSPGAVIPGEETKGNLQLPYIPVSQAMSSVVHFDYNRIIHDSFCKRLLLRGWLRLNLMNFFFFLDTFPVNTLLFTCYLTKFQEILIVTYRKFWVY